MVGGLILLFFGWQEMGSFASEVSETFTGSPTDNAVWYLVIGAILTVTGILMAVTDKGK